VNVLSIENQTPDYEDFFPFQLNSNKFSEKKMAQGTEAIKIIIRTTNNKYADFPMEMSSFLTIYDLKQNITLNHPTKPVKLFIYSSLFFLIHFHRYPKINV
jgi:hypothetical protein